MGDGGGSCLKFVAVKKWFHANSSSLGSSSESSWWNTQMQKEPVALCLRSARAQHGIVKSGAKQTASLIFLRLADLLGMKGIWNIPVAPSMV